MVLREDLATYSDREILIQLRIAVAKLEERTAYLPKAAAKMGGQIDRVDNDVKWLKKVLYTAAPLGPIFAGLTALATRMIN